MTILDGETPFSPLEVVALCASVLEETEEPGPVGLIRAYTEPHVPGLRLVGTEAMYSADWLTEAS